MLTFISGLTYYHKFAYCVVLFYTVQEYITYVVTVTKVAIKAFVLYM